MTGTMNNDFDFTSQPTQTTRVIRREEGTFFSAFGRNFGGSLGTLFALALFCLLIYGGIRAVRFYNEQQNQSQYRTR